MKNRKTTPAQYKSAIAGLTPPFIIIEVMFAALAAYLFVAYSERPIYGGVFLILAGVLAAVYVAMLLVLRKRGKNRPEREKNEKRKKIRWAGGRLPCGVAFRLPCGYIFVIVINSFKAGNKSGVKNGGAARPPARMWQEIA